ncbi:hypothetical protein HGM15179_017344 [Zosterops borbonicus]|uniref:Uncharacterized protein n=1 Tax=Zosterops borbonicus TaxID=364589 RepID=A0A8K1LDF6_9PASS|nr:hypothetical protein HGM15179_017344 [Zosterops borbonicus]
MESTALEMLPEAAGAGLQLRRDLRRIRCALLLCLLAVLLLLLPTAYLLLGHLRAPASCAGQVTEERASHFLKQRAVAGVMDTLSSAEKPRAHLTGTSIVQVRAEE